METKPDARAESHSPLCTRTFLVLIGMLAAILAAALMAGGPV
ncbi:hypothetical protein [Histidinibacterium lentulum]|nr:hypothetical protein [Histidinibacterium lentulum]